MAWRRTPVPRSEAVARMRERLERHGFPRLQMALIVGLTGGFGLLASWALLQAGLLRMGLRYPLALGCAYLFFLFLIWLWLRTQTEDWADAAQVPDVWPTGPSHATSSSSSEMGDALGAVGSVGDADELAVPLLLLALAVGLALAMCYVIYIAPLLLAEVAVDGALSYALFRHLRGQDPQHWLAGTVRRTAWPFVLTALLLAGVGAGLSHWAPGAHTLGEARALARTAP